jgi:hypothetical protein
MPGTLNYFMIILIPIPITSKYPINLIFRNEESQLGIVRELSQGHRTSNRARFRSQVPLRDW